jgi:hypothetical protein
MICSRRIFLSNFGAIVAKIDTISPQDAEKGTPQDPVKYACNINFKQKKPTKTPKTLNFRVSS